MSNNSVFISYRRETGYPWARLVWDGLRDRSVDAFLDLESMRAAGRFDQRLLNQIGSRPYFLVVLTEGTLDRCSDAEDWVRREIEYAIASDRIIVPLFVAPYEPSACPPGVPEDIEQALSQSNGLTIYSQYLTAAMDKLAEELLTPVTLPAVGLTDDDERFQSQAVREVEALPAPAVPSTPSPGFGTGGARATTDEVIAVPPRDGVTGPAVETGPDSGEVVETGTGPEAPPQPEVDLPERGGASGPASATGHAVADGDRDDDTSPPVVEPADVPIVNAELGALAGPGGDTAADASADQPTVSAGEPLTPASRPAEFVPDPDPDSDWTNSNRLLLVIGGIVAAVVLGVGAIVATSGGGADDPTGEERSQGGPTTPPDDTGATDDPTGEDVTRTQQDGTWDGELPPGAWLQTGHVVQAGAGGHELVMTPSGELQLRTRGEVVWAPDYPATPSAAAILQPSDGNFVVYRSEETTGADAALWASNTSGIGEGAVLRVVDEGGRGVVLIDDADGVERWRMPPAERAGGTGATGDAGAGDECTTMLSLGCSGDDVARLQQLLDDKGFRRLEADGTFGPRTEAALAGFEVQCSTCTADRRIEVDGEEWQTLTDMDPVDAELAAHASADAGPLAGVTENWVVQLSAKYVGIVADEETWDADRVLAEHEMFRDRYGALLAAGDDFNIGLEDEDWVVTLLPQVFADADEGLQWCRDEGFGSGDCFVRFLSDDPTASAQAQFNP